MVKWPWQTAMLVLSALLPLLSGYAQDDSTSTESEWLMNTQKDAFAVTDGDLLTFLHTLGDVRIRTADTDRIQVTIIAQYHTDDPRAPIIRFVPGEAGDNSASHKLMVNFAYLEIAEDEAWAKRRIDVGLLVPKGLRLQIETGDGLIEAEHLEAAVELKSVRGEITYEGTGDLTAHTERGSIRAHLSKTSATHSVALSSLTGDINCIFLEGANAQVEVSTRGPLTTDYSIDINRDAGSVLKQGRVQIGKDGSKIRIESHNGSVRLQGLIVPENRQ